jgi:hypothetical protein
MVAIGVVGGVQPTTDTASDPAVARADQRADRGRGRRAAEREHEDRGDGDSQLEEQRIRSPFCVPPVAVDPITVIHRGDVPS